MKISQLYAGCHVCVRVRVRVSWLCHDIVYCMLYIPRTVQKAPFEKSISLGDDLSAAIESRVARVVLHRHDIR